MSPYKNYDFPKMIKINNNSYSDIIDILRIFSPKLKIGVVVDHTTWKIAGKEIVTILEKYGYNAKIYYATEASIKESHNLINFCYNESINLLIAVGGGSIIDVSKYSSFQIKIPFISIPTVASHDGIASATASLKGNDFKESFKCKPPCAVLVNLRIIKNSPIQFSIAGCSDVLSNYSAILDWEYANKIKGEEIILEAKYIALKSYNLIKNNIDIIRKWDFESIRTLIEALLLSSKAMCIAGSSRPASGAEHLISHAIDRIAKKPILHGYQVGLTTIINLYLHNANWQEHKLLLNVLGAPTTLAETTITCDEMIKALLNAHKIRKNRYTILGDSGLTLSAIEKLLIETGICNKSILQKTLYQNGVS
ncbi:MAG: iron-containing alcohol dehydrogenase [Candidatus Heimdallarchaeaceae archaeon]